MYDLSGRKSNIATNRRTFKLSHYFNVLCRSTKWPQHRTPSVWSCWERWQEPGCMMNARRRVYLSWRRQVGIFFRTLLWFHLIHFWKFKIFISMNKLYEPWATCVQPTVHTQKNMQLFNLKMTITCTWTECNSYYSAITITFVKKISLLE